MRLRGYVVALAVVAGVVGGGAFTAVQASAPPAVATADQAKQLATGTWRATVDDPSGAPINMTLALRGDGTYTRTYAGGDPTPPATNGTWTVQPAGEGRFSLTLVRAGQPAAEARPLVFRVIDKDTLQNETENYRARRAP
jgi:hypothetical protein